MEELLEILNDIDDSVDYESEKALIDDHLLDSFGIITLIAEYRTDLIQLLKKLSGLIISTVLSALMASVILFPIVNVFLHDARMDSETQFHLLYPAKYYRLFLSQFAAFDTIGSWTFMSFGVLTIVAIYLMFRLRKSRRLMIFFALSVIVLLVPFAGHVLNGMSYPSNRWEFAFSLLCAYILVKLWPDLMNLSRKEALADIAAKKKK